MVNGARYLPKTTSGLLNTFKVLLAKACIGTNNISYTNNILYVSTLE